MAHQQLIPEIITQLGECIADRRLGQRMTLGGSRETAFGKQRFQGHQMIEVESMKAHGRYPVGTDVKNFNTGFVSASSPVLMA